MTSEPFRSRRERGLLILTLDTPRARVNIFDRPAAEQLSRILRRLPRGIEAIVFESAKPGSFINGVGLMMASSVRSLASAKQIAGPIVDAYGAVERAPVPTIAAIRGNCFGCGVEFALRCTHRIAAVTPDTQFYMTELADYLFTPAFGGVGKLPQLLGLDRAADFLLWGERWNAQDALRFGLIDRAVKRDFRRAIDELLARPPKPKPKRPLPAARHRRRIDALPPSQRELYACCLERMIRGPDPEAELALSAKTAADPISKRALGFFFIRQIATDLSLAARGARLDRMHTRRAITGRPIEGPTLYRPDRLRKRALVELAHGGAQAVKELTARGLIPFVSKPKTNLAIDVLLRAHLEPLLGALDRGTSIRTINQTLRVFGFVERPHALLERLPCAKLFPRADLGNLRDPSFSGRPDQHLLDRLCISWLAAARQLLETMTIAHPTTVDLIARELLDFPLEHGSLCSYLTRARVQAALHSVGETTLGTAQDYVASRHDFYA